ncbi:hypothetical protein BD289DRAFT_451926 [Coniella lustricola]|uniref:Uncharacterized protein n=1 Tax=Coniella lustricola TaxID=2025994 RepID=A0A2T3AD51_9PEZI|nr:hypothetical protein BD289DRAFT_451926 [Coniella lustricola]
MVARFGLWALSTMAVRALAGSSPAYPNTTTPSAASCAAWCTTTVSSGGTAAVETTTLTVYASASVVTETYTVFIVPCGHSSYILNTYSAEPHRSVFVLPLKHFAFVIGPDQQHQRSTTATVFINETLLSVSTVDTTETDSFTITTTYVTTYTSTSLVPTVVVSSYPYTITELECAYTTPVAYKARAEDDYTITVFVTSTDTITSCASTITDCPARETSSSIAVSSTATSPSVTLPAYSTSAYPVSSDCFSITNRVLTSYITETLYTPTTYTSIKTVTTRTTSTKTTDVRMTETETIWKTKTEKVTSDDYLTTVVTKHHISVGAHHNCLVSDETLWTTATVTTSTPYTVTSYVTSVEISDEYFTATITETTTTDEIQTVTQTDDITLWSTTVSTLVVPTTTISRSIYYDIFADCHK